MMDKAYELKPDTLGHVPLSLIDPDPDQVRKVFDDDYIEQLSISIKASGVIQPIVLRKHPETPGRFLIVAGENRWRASKLAKTKTIPAVLREVDGLDKLLLQLKENHQRKDLNPMEWSEALFTMHKVHGLKQTDIEKTLKDSGVANFGRAYIANMIRLRELPEWVQSLIRNNAISASHGTYLIPAMKSDKVMEQLRVKFEEQNWTPTRHDLQQQIYWMFSRTHIDLTNYKTSFDYRVKCVKTGCQKMRKISTEGGTESTFCFDEQCHAILQAEHRKEEAEKDAVAQREPSGGDEGSSGESAPRELSFDEQGRVDINQQKLEFHKDYLYMANADFDTKGCEGCKHCRIALEGSDEEESEEEMACFLVSCYHEKEDEAKRADRLVKQHMIDKLTKVICANPASIMSLFAWAASHYPTLNRKGDDYSFGAPSIYEDDEDHMDLLEKHGLTSLTAFMRAGAEQLAELTALFVENLGIKQLAELWKVYCLKDDDYRIDEHYLAEHTAEEISALLNAIEWPPASFAELANAEKAGTVDQFARSHADAIGVPAPIRFAFDSWLKEEDSNAEVLAD